MAQVFERALPEYVLVRVDGSFAGIDSDVTERLPGRVVVTMPDFTADSLAHALSQLDRLATLIEMERPGLGLDELAEGLYAAAAASGYRCPSGSVLGEVG